VIDPSAQGGAAGEARGGDEDGEQDKGLVEAQPHGTGGDGELPLLVLGAVKGLREPEPQLAILLPKEGDLLEQLAARGAGQLCLL
jgi:hypothetical protein